MVSRKPYTKLIDFYSHLAEEKKSICEEYGYLVK